MEIALHLGAHFTDDGRLMRCLSTNQPLLATQRIAVPKLAQYRELLLAMASTADTDTLAPAAGRMLFETAAIPENSRRAVFSDPKLLGWKGGAVRVDRFYPNAATRIAALRAALRGHSVELFLAIRNPASFIPALLQDMKPAKSKSILKKMAPQTLRWSDLVTELRNAWPEASLSVWCDEDTPFIWHQLLARVSGHSSDTVLAGSYDWFDQVMIKGGAEKLEAYLTSVPPVDDTHRQRVIAAFLDKFCDPDKLDIDVNVAGWDADMVESLSERYEDDVARLAELPGVTLIQP